MNTAAGNPYFVSFGVLSEQSLTFMQLAPTKT